MVVRPRAELDNASEWMAAYVSVSGFVRAAIGVGTKD